MNLSSYALSFQKSLETISGCSKDPFDSFNELSEDVKISIISFVLECACAAQRCESLDLGIKSLEKVPKDDLVRIIGFMDKVVNFDCSYELSRFLTVFNKIGIRELVDYGIEKGLQSKDEDAREVAKEEFDIIRKSSRPTMNQNR